MKRPKIYDFSGWATKNDLRCSDGRTIRHGAFKEDDGRKVPLVWMHQHNTPENVLGHAILENRDEGVYAYCTFNDSYAGQQSKELVSHGDIESLSIWANNLTQNGGDVLHGSIKEVSLVLAGANPGAMIDYPVMAHGEESTTEAYICVDEPVLMHADDDKDEEPEEKKEESPKEEAKDERTVKDVVDAMSDEKKAVVAYLCGMALEDGAKHADDDSDEWLSHADEDEKESDEEGDDGPSVQDVLDSMTEEERKVTEFLVGQALEEGKNNPEAATKEDVAEHSDEGEETFMSNVFDRTDMESRKQDAVLSHSDGIEIINLAKSNGGGSLKAAIATYAQNHNKTLAPLRNGPAPEMLTTDQSWIGHVMRKTAKSPKSRLRVRFADARDLTGRRAQGYTKGTQKQFMGNLDLLGRTVDPTTVYNLDKMNRDDVLDIQDFNLVDYMYKSQRMNLEEELARAIMIGDGRNGDENDGQPIDKTKIIPIWGDDALFSIHTVLDVDGMRTTMNGTNSSANFGDNYKGFGAPDFYCTPHLVNVMLLARDLNGRRIYDNVNELRAAMNVNELVTVEQFAGKTREVTVNGSVQTRRLLGILVNLKDYVVGSVRGGEITHFTDFDIRFNQNLSLLETRLCGMLERPYSAIVLEEVVNP